MEKSGSTSSSDSTSTSSSDSTSTSSSDSRPSSASSSPLNSPSSKNSQSGDSMSGALPDPLLEEFASESGLGSFEESINSENLFPGSSVSVLGALAMLFAWFSAFPGISKEALGKLLYILHNFLLPSGNLLPASYAQAFSLIQSLLVPVQEYHCCVNDCILYRDSYSKLSHCPKCGEAHFSEGGKVARKRFKYIPLGPRIRLYFSSARISQLLQSNIKPSNSNDIHDIQQSDAWKSWYASKGVFHGDPRGLALALCLDGTNPFSKEKNAYSMWPITVSFLNLPPEYRRLAGFLKLLGIIPGKSEPKHTDPYLEVFVDELLDLNKTLIYDAYQDNMFKLNVSVMLHVLDYPGQCKIFHCHGEKMLLLKYYEGIVL